MKVTEPSLSYSIHSPLNLFPRAGDAWHKNDALLSKWYESQFQIPYKKLQVDNFNQLKLDVA